jgi:hypothetical protein
MYLSESRSQNKTATSIGRGSVEFADALKWIWFYRSRDARTSD